MRVGDRSYLYVNHSKREGKKKKTVKHYVGPVEGYRYAEMFLDLGLTAFHEVDYLEVAKKAIDKHIEKLREICKYRESSNVNIKIGDVRRCIDSEIETRRKLDELIKYIEKKKFSF